MEVKCYLDKAIDEYLSKMQTITAKKIMNYVYSEYNIDAKIEEIGNRLKANASILEIVDGIFVDKHLFLSFVEKIDKHLLKSEIEFEYFISINENQVVKILHIIELYKKIEIENTIEEKWTYRGIVNFGMEHGYVKSDWVQSIDYNLEKEVYDYFEAIENMQEKGIGIKY